MSEEQIRSIEDKKANNNSALVLGAGIGGIKVALDLAEMGHKVHLLDDSPYIGGTLTKLDRQFPTNDCGMCKMLPSFGDDFCQDMCLRRGFVHPKIKISINTPSKKRTIIRVSTSRQRTIATRIIASSIWFHTKTGRGKRKLFFS